MSRRFKYKKRGLFKKRYTKIKKKFYGKGRFSALANLVKGGLKFFQLKPTLKKSINNQLIYIYKIITKVMRRPRHKRRRYYGKGAKDFIRPTLNIGRIFVGEILPKKRYKKRKRV